ncbi:uncharacterized protein LOC129756950 [Uranotaenia lowii]|uniref:uncharacterized protein LOC129756950 n=1 Tax=Uranotaenia lowii TaxID=190385 RepID=UPI00247A1C96|nr:uncharacterized protein LOC129756950 [Uranotaenia lowii]
MSPAAELLGVILLLLPISAVLAIECRYCVSPVSLADCHDKATEESCTPDMANKAHQAVKNYRPDLANPTNSTAVRCLKLEIMHNFDGSITYASGCFWKTVNYCDGWPESETIKSCRSCNLGDPDSVICASESQTTPNPATVTGIPDSSSTANPGGSSTANPGSSSTSKPEGSSTAEPGNGSPSGIRLSLRVLMLGAFTVLAKIIM